MILEVIVLLNWALHKHTAVSFFSSPNEDTELYTFNEDGNGIDINSPYGWLDLSLYNPEFNSIVKAINKELPKRISRRKTMAALLCFVTNLITKPNINLKTPLNHEFYKQNNIFNPLSIRYKRIGTITKLLEASEFIKTIHK